ncbi:MAG TPA: Si-specific NAD(P)(+) transhydrogenase [Dehalococcoidia bacterium]|nr:Si-specific NAD(P)(+) transhydrogenase [Dehalococcoidia bacterium]
MADGRYDLIVIGSGPAGEKGAAQAAYFGKRVAVIERGDVGGSATNTGTLPSKVLRETAVHFAELRQRDPYGIHRPLDQQLTPDELFFRQRAVVEAYRGLVAANIKRHGIDYFEGGARLTGPNEVEVRLREGGTRLLGGDFILIATGSRPMRPPEVPFDGEAVFDSDTVLGLKRLPASMIVVGGGVVGCEYASLLQALGIRVTLLDRDPSLLPFIDDEVALLLQSRMQEAGLDLRLNASARAYQRTPNGVRAELADGEAVEAEALLFTGGRVGNTEGLGLQALGIEVDAKGRVKVDQRFRTAVPSVMAAGDVIGFPALANTSMEQGRVAVCQAFGFEYKTEVSSLLPYAVYTIPEVSKLGLSEEEAAAAGREAVVGRGYYRENARGQIAGDTGGMVKLVFERETRELLGVHIIGQGASELVHVGQACMYYKGTIDYFIDSVFNFPTLTDVYKYAAYDGLGRLASR